uniref:Uncharacterized protein n=1 Tax=Arundo donax TaxID=35708 RepID=A0A0A9BLK9_ARUDO
MQRSNSSISIQWKSLLPLKQGIILHDYKFLAIKYYLVTVSILV